MFGAAVGVGNTLMEFSRGVNFAVRSDRSEATIPLSRMDPDATVVQAFLVWAGTFQPSQGIPLDRDVDFTLPDGTFFNDLSVDAPEPGETPSALNRCVSRNLNIGGQTQPMFECRREVTQLLQRLGPGGAVGTYGVEDVQLEAGDCNNDPGRCEAAYGGWAIVVLWESPTESVKRDLVVYDGFFALDEQGSTFGGFSSGIGPAFDMNGFTIGPTADGELTFLAFEGDADLGVPPQNLPSNPVRCNDGKCEDFIQIRTDGNPTFKKLQDAANRPGNLMNGSDNTGGVHPGLDIDTFDIGPSGLNVLRAGDTHLFLQPGSGDGVADDGSGGSGELFLLGMTFLSVETFSPRFLNNFTEKVVLEPVAGAGETLHYLLRVENDGSAPAENALIRDQLPAGVSYVPGSTSNTCGVASGDRNGTSPVLQGTGLNVGTIPINGRCEVRFNVTVDADVADGTVLDNFFTVAADGVPPILIGPATTVIQAASIGQPTKTVSVLGGGEPSQGSTLNYTIRVPNTGTRNAPGVSVTDALPPELENLQIVSFPAGADNRSSATNVDITGITIAPGASADVVFTARVKAGTPTGTRISNQGRVDQPSLSTPLRTDNPATPARPDPTVITTASGVSLTSSSKSARDKNGGRLQPGDVVEFTVHVAKTGSASTVIDLDDSLPLHMGGCVVVSSPPGGFANCTPGGANGTGRVVGAVAVAGAGGGDFVFSAVVDATAPDGFSLVNTAHLTPEADPSFAVDVSSAPLAVFARPDFTTSRKAVVDGNGGDARPGDALTYTVTVVNNGSVAAQNVVVTDAVPGGLGSVVALDGGAFAPSGGAPPASPGTVTWTAPALAAGATATFRFTTQILAGTPNNTRIRNTALVHGDAPAADFTTPPVDVVVRASPALVVTKTVADLGPPPFRPGDTVRYTLRIQNTGDGAASNVVLRDTLDPSFETALTNNGGRVAGGDVVFDTSTVAALSRLEPPGVGAPGADVVTLTFDARLSGVLANGTVVANQGRTTADQLPSPVLSDDPGTATANDPTRFTVTSQAVVSMDKTFVDDNAGALLPGDTVTYTLTLNDTGDAPAGAVVVTDVLDNRLTFVASPDGGAVSGVGGGGAGGTVTFPARDVVPGAAVQLRFTVRVATGLANGTVIANQARAASPVAATTVSNDPSTVTPLDPTRLTVESRPVLDDVQKTVTDLDGDGRFEPGDRVRYTITVPNTGSEAAAAVVVTDVLPAALENAVAGQGGVVVGAAARGAAAPAAPSRGRSAPSPSASRARSRWTRTSCAPSATPSPSTTRRASRGATSPPLSRTIRPRPRSTIPRASSRSPSRTSSSKRPSPTRRPPAGPASSRPATRSPTPSRSANDGGRAADAVTVTDLVDTRLDTVTPLDGGALAGRTITWSVASIATDAVATLRFTALVHVPLPNGVIIPNRARAVLAEPGVPGVPFLSDDPRTAAAGDTTDVQVVSAADLSATTLETLDPLSGAPITFAQPGQAVRYRLVVQNRGTDDGRRVRARLVLPPEVELVSAPGATVNGATLVYNRQGVAALADVAPGDVVTLDVDVRLKAPLSVTQPISAQAELTAAGVANPFRSDDPSTAAFGDPTLLDVLSLVVTKDVAPSRTAAPGDVLTWTITAASGGTIAVGPSTLTDVVSPALSTVTPGPGLSFDAASRTLSGALAPIAPGTSRTLTFTARVGNTAANGTRIENQATVQSAALGAVLSDDPTTAAALDPTVVLVDATPVLTTSTKVAADVDGAPLLPGDTVRYVVTVVNSGRGTADDVRVTDVLDANLSVLAVENGGNNAGNTISWDASTTPALAAVARGASVVLAFTAKVSPAVVDGTSIPNQASIVSRDVSGAVRTDDPSTPAPGDPTVVRVTAPKLSLTKRFVDNTPHPGGGVDVEPGDAVEYDVTVRNTGGVAATGVVVTDVLPPGVLVDVSVLDGGSDDAGLVTWTVPRVPPGGSAVVRVRATVDPLATGGTRIENRAEATANEVGLAVRSDDPDTATPDDATVRVVTASELWHGTVELFDADSGAPIVTPVIPQQRIRGRITFQNDGNQTAQAVVLTVPVQQDRIVVDSTTGGGVVDQAGVRWDASQNPAFVRMSTGQGAQVEFTGRMASPLPDDIDIPVEGLVVTAAVPTPPAVIGPAVLHTRSRPDLSATTKEVIDDDGGLVEPGDLLTYRITVLNDGGVSAPNVHVFDAIPGGMVYVANSTRLRGQPVADPAPSVSPLQAPSSAGQPAGLAVGDLDAGRSAVVEMKVRVSPAAPRGVRIDNQAVLTASGAPDAVSDNPNTPLILGDPTPVIVGGGASLVAEKVGAPSPVVAGDALHFDIHIENVGTEPALGITADDVVPRGTHYLTGSLVVDGVPATDAADRDDADVSGAGLVTVHLHRALLEAGEGVTLGFDVKVDSASVVENQAQVASENAGSLLTDGDPLVPGAQPTVVPVKNARAIVIDPDTVRIIDDRGGVLLPGDTVTVRATVRNQSLEHVVLDGVELGVSALLDVVPEAVTAADPRLRFDAAQRVVRFVDGTSVDIEDGGAFDVTFPATVSGDARTGDTVRALGSAHVHTLDGALEKNANLGRAALTVGLLPGTGAIEGTLFLDGGEHDEVFQPETDARVRGMSVLAFWRDDTEPVQTAIADDQGHFQLLPVPAGRYRLELRSPGGASFGAVGASELQSGEVRERDIAVTATGAVYLSGSQRVPEGARVQLFADDGDADPDNDVLVSDRLLGEGQQGQPVTAQGLYRFDPPPGRYRIAVEPPDPLTSFPSSAVPVAADSAGNPFGAFAALDGAGDVEGVTAPLPVFNPRGAGAGGAVNGGEPYFLRFDVQAGGPPLSRNFIPVDALKSQLTLTKTANHKRASVGDIVSYTVRVDNRALAGVTTADGGVEIIDTLPFGFRLVDGSYRLDRITTDGKGQQRRSQVVVKDHGGTAHVFGPFEMLPSSAYELRYNVVVGPGTTTGPHENRAALRMAAGQVPLSEDALASVQVVADGLFDLGTIRGKVFCDDDGDGWQDAGEQGLPGVRMVVDTGQWTDSDVTGKAHFSAIPAGMHLVKLDERTLPPGTVPEKVRETFYMSPGLPAEISFGAKCVFSSEDKPEVVVNEAAYAPGEGEGPVKHHLEGQASPAKLTVDGVAVDVQRADLGVGVEGEDPAFAGAAGPNLPAVVDGGLRPRVEFIPRVDGGAAPVAWQIEIEALGLPAPSGAEPPSSGVGSASAPRAVEVDPLAQPRTVWMFAGHGAPPSHVFFDGKDPQTGSEELFEHQLYRATLTVGFEDGARATSAARVFGVRAGAGADDAPGQTFEIDSVDGELFSRAGRPTARLSGWLGGHATALRGKKVTVVVHTDQTGAAARSLTARRAAAAKKALVGFGLAADDVAVKGAGDAFPKMPNLRRRDRLTNRRVEIVVDKSESALPPLAAPAAVAPSARVNGKEVAGDGAFAVDVSVPRGDALAVELVSSTGAVTRVVKSDTPAAASTETPAAPLSVSFNPGSRALTLDGDPVSAALLGVRIARAALAADGSAVIEPALPPKPAAADGANAIVAWTVRVFVEKDGAPAFAEDDAAIGPVVRELSGEGRPPAKIAWDGLDADGQKVPGGRLRARLIVKTAGGDTGISPDAPLLAGAAGVAGAPVVIADPLDAHGKLTAAANNAVKALAAQAKDAAAVKITVHSDDSGTQLNRRFRTQNGATAMKALLVAAGVPAAKVSAVGMGSDKPLVPNLSRKMREENRRAEVVLVAPAAPAPTSTSTPVAPALRANGQPLAQDGERLGGQVPATRSGETVLDLRDADGARATLHVRPNDAGEVWEGDAPAYAAWVAMAAPVELAPPAEAAAAPVGGAASGTPVEGAGRARPVAGAAPVDGIAPLTPAKPKSAGPPTWYPDVQKLGAHDLVVELPADTSALHADTLLVRGRTNPQNKLRIGTDEVAVDPDTGAFVHVVKLPEGDSDLVVEATDPTGNVGRIKRAVNVDTTGWFALLLADTAFGGDGADLGERTPFTSVKLGDTFLYGRGAAFVQGRWHGPWMFQDYALTLDVDTRRWQSDVFDPELIDPERFFPVYGDSSVENVDATRSAFPLYVDLKADSSSLIVGNVRTDLQAGSLFRYQRARSGAQLVFDRGWTAPLETPYARVNGHADGPAAAADNNPWRTTVTTFVAGGGGQRHARVELLGTGSSVYFLRHERVVEGSESVAIIVRDAVTGAEVSRTPQVRDVDYNIRYDEGRVMFKEPVGAFADDISGLTINHNLGQVQNADRVFVEVEYEHQEDDPFMGVGAGAQLKQRVLGHAEVGGGYVYESREGGALGYQLGGGHVRLFVDDNTWIQGELLGSQSVDAGNFVSLDGGLTYSSLGQSLDQKDGQIGRQIFPADRAGVAFKLEGNAQLGTTLGRKDNADANLHAYVQQLQPGFFADASIVEQGQTKWGTEAAWRIVDDGKLKLRYDGVVSEIPEVQPLTEFRTLHREIATAHYEHRVLAPLTVFGEYGFGYTYDSGSFGRSAIAPSHDFVTNVVALGVDWQLLERVELGLKQELVLTGDPNQLKGPLDQLVSHLLVKYALTEDLSLVGGSDLRWSGENQEHLGVSYAINKGARVYASERVGVLPAPVTGTMGFNTTTVVGGETDVGPGSQAYAEYQLDGGFSGDQSRGVVGLKTAYRLPFGFALNFGYERIMLVGGTVPTTEGGNVPPGAFTDGTFYAAPGANAGGAFLAGEGSRDAVSAGVELKRGEAVVASQRFELRYDNRTEARGGHDRLWLLSGSGGSVRLSPELSLLGRYNIALAQDLALSEREAYFEEGAFGVAYRPVTHDWFSVLAKISRRVDVRPLSLEAGTSDDYTAHAMSVEPIVELPWKVQLVEKLALKHASEKLDDVPEANALTGLWINRVNLHALGLIKSLGVKQPLPGEIDLGVEYRVLAGFTYGTVEHGPLVEVQVAPVEYFRVGVGYNFTSFSDDELDSGKLDRSGFFVRAVGSF